MISEAVDSAARFIAATQAQNGYNQAVTTTEPIYLSAQADDVDPPEDPPSDPG